ncbi:MAG: SemiSWEET family transporter [Dehalococcoidia bacterium]|nr:SemiSWEET family transporter [Dehalococcoidia bacterium]
MTVALVPQLVKIFRLKSALEISLPFTILLLVGMLCWLGYGILVPLFPVILWNAVGATLVAVLLFAKLKYGRRR